MSRLCVLLMSLLLTTTASAQDGPFGIQFGTNPSQYQSCKPTESAGYYKCSTAPKAHSSFESYILLAAEGYGICWIKGIGIDIAADSFGIAVKSKVNELSDQISAKYGSPRLVDTLLPGSIWREPNDWMMGILKGERMYAYNWKDTDKLKSFPEIEQIYVSASAYSSSKGYVNVEFYSVNHSACKTAAKKGDADKF